MQTIETKVCPGCKESTMFEVTDRQFAELHMPRGQRPLIQDIVPELSATDRERLMTGWCGPCWDKLWEETD